MRIDKFLKISRVIKRRTVAKDAADGGRIFINDKPAKPSDRVKIGDIVLVEMGKNPIKLRVRDIKEHTTKESSSELYEIL